MTRWLPHAKTERQRSIYNFCLCIFENSKAMQWHSAIIELVATFRGKNACDNIAIMSWKWASMED